MREDTAAAAPRRRGSRWHLAVAVVLGTIFGIGVATFWRRDANERDTRALEARLDALESQRSPDAGTKPPSRAPHSVEQGRKLLRAEVDRVRREPHDPTWAPGVEKLLSTELRELAPKGRFELGKVSCGTTSCIAELTWAAGAHPVEHGTVILHHPFSANCERMLVAAPADRIDSDATNRGEVLFDCTKWRERGAR